MSEHFQMSFTSIPGMRATRTSMRSAGLTVDTKGRAQA